MEEKDDSIQFTKEYLAKNREKLEKLKKTIKEQDTTLAMIKKDLEALGVTFGHTIHIPNQMETLSFPKELSDAIGIMRDLVEALPKEDKVSLSKKGFLHHSRKLQML